MKIIHTNVLLINILLNKNILLQQKITSLPQNTQITAACNTHEYPGTTFTRQNTSMSLIWPTRSKHLMMITQLDACTLDYWDNSLYIFSMGI